jgi:hypothetical protein
MRVASQRWPEKGALPARVADLQCLVDTYYESGENPRERVL